MHARSMLALPSSAVTRFDTDVAESPRVGVSLPVSAARDSHPDIDETIAEALTLLMDRLGVNEAKASAALIASAHRTRRTVAEVAAAAIRTASTAQAMRALRQESK